MFRARFEREREKIFLRLDEEIRAALSEDRIPDVTESFQQVFGDQSIGEFPDTREMRFFIEDVAAFTPGLISRLRYLVSKEFPRWIVVPQFEDCAFEVSNTGV